MSPLAAKAFKTPFFYPLSFSRAASLAAISAAVGSTVTFVVVETEASVSIVVVVCEN